MSEPDRQPRENWRETFVNQVYRLFKLCRIHDLENEAVQKALTGSAERLQELLEEYADFLNVIFAGDNIFVNGKPLRASRATYESILELGELLKEVNFNELTVRPGVERQDLAKMLQTYMQRRENPELRTEAHVDVSDAIRYRRIDPKELLDLEEDADLTSEEQVMKVYPAAVVTMRRFLEEIRNREFRLIRFLKRLSQRLVALSDTAAETLLAITALKKTRDEPGGIAVNAGILGLLMARRITDSYRALQRICYSSMVADIGRPRAAGVYEKESARVIPKLDRSGKEELGPSNALILLGNSRISEPSLRRAIIAYESGWLINKEAIGWPFGQQKRPTMEALIVQVARRFWNLMALKPTMKQRRSPAEVFEILEEEAKTKVERAVVELCRETLGFYEVGDVVETSTGWKGVVVRPGQEMADFPRPVVRFVRDQHGNAISPQDLDLAAESTDASRFGVVAKQLRGVGDPKLRELSKQLRQEAGREKQPAPKKYRPRNAVTERKSRQKREQKRKKKQQREQQKKKQQQKRKKKKQQKRQQKKKQQQRRQQQQKQKRQPSQPASGGAGKDPSNPPQDGGEESGGEVVLEFGPGSTSPKRKTSAPSQPSSASSTGPSSSGAGRPERSGGQPNEEPAAIPLSDVEPAEESSPSSSSPEPLDPNSISPADISETETESTGGGQQQEMSTPQGATEQMTAEESSRALGDFVDQQEPSEPEAESREFPAESDAEEMDATRVDETAGLLRDYVDSVEAPAPTEEEIAEHEADAPEESAPEESGRLGDFANSLQEATSGEEIQKTERVSSEMSHELLRDFVDEDDSDSEPQTDSGGSDDPMEDSRLGEFASGFEEDTSPEQADATAAVDSEKSKELLDSFVEEAPGGTDRQPPASTSGQEDLSDFASSMENQSMEEENATAAVSSEKSKELLDGFVDEMEEGDENPPQTRDEAGPGGGLSDFAESLDETEMEEENATAAVSSEKSKELLDSFVEEAPGEGRSGEGPDTEDGGAAGGDLGDFADSFSDTAQEEENATAAMDSEKSREILQSFVDEVDGAAEEEEQATQRVSSEKSSQMLRDFVDQEDES